MKYKLKQLEARIVLDTHQILQSLCKVLFLKIQSKWQNVNICQISAESTWMYVILCSALFSGLEIFYNKLFFKMKNKKYMPHGVRLGG